jgi:teichoic acid transport system ATP-binding protein
VIDRDPKTFYIKGTGEGFDRPWGGRKNMVIDNMEPYKNLEFNVNKTEKVGKNIWYRGMLNEKEVWIHFSHLTEQAK